MIRPDNYDDWRSAAETEPFGGERDLVALVWAGRAEAECQRWTIAFSGTGTLKLQHPTLAGRKIAEPGLPKS